MNILFVSDFFQPYSAGAANISTYLIARKLAEKNNCYIVTQKFQKKSWVYGGLNVYPILPKYSSNNSIRNILYTEIFSFLRFQNVFSFYKVISEFCKEKKIDVINVQANNLVLIIALLLLNKPVVIDVRDYFFTCRFMLKTKKCDRHHLFCLPSNATKRSNPLIKLVSKSFFRYQTFIYFIQKNLLLKPLMRLKKDKYVFVPNSEYVANTIRDEFRGIDVSIQVIHNPINANDYGNNIKKQKNTVLFASSLENSKGIWNCIFAIEKLSRNITFEIAGDGPETESIKKYIEKKGLKNIKMLGKLNYDESIKAYEKAYITIQPSVWPEPFGRYILESFGSGTPLITTPTGGSTEAIEDGKTGLLVPVNDSKKLADAIKELITKQELYKRIQRNIKIESIKYLPQSIAHERMELYKKYV
jgi:glycosyltransferase involved in cell wall biosynthesis